VEQRIDENVATLLRTPLADRYAEAVGDDQVGILNLLDLRQRNAHCLIAHLRQASGIVIAAGSQALCR
jgi:hypothetical protein